MLNTRKQKLFITYNLMSLAVPLVILLSVTAYGL